jgi:hypothetical protein
MAGVRGGAFHYFHVEGIHTARLDANDDLSIERGRLRK